MDAAAARRLFHLSLAAWCVILAVSWALGGPLGHDEAAYAVGGRELLAGRPLTWLYRSMGMNVLAVPGAAVGSELVLRAPLVLLALLYPFAVRRVGRQLDEATAAWATAVLVGTHCVTMRAHELMSDLPSTTAMLFGLAVLVEELGRADGPRWRLVWAAPLFAAAFYLRYASCLPVAFAGALAALLFARRILARPAPVLATAALLAALLAPHLWHATVTTGAPLGILRLSSTMPNQQYVGDGLVTFLTANPLVLYGVVTTPPLVAGALAVLRPAPAGRRVTWLFWLVAVAQLVAIGLSAYGQPRFVFLAITLLVVLGVELLRRALGPRLALGRPLLALLALAWLGALVIPVARANRADDWRRPVVEAAEVVRRDAAGRPCYVVAHHFTQAMWYAGCARGDLGLGLASPGPLVYGVWITAKDEVPDVAGFRGPDGAPLAATALADHPGRFVVRRFTPAPP